MKLKNVQKDALAELLMKGFGERNLTFRVLEDQGEVVKIQAGDSIIEIHELRSIRIQNGSQQVQAEGKQFRGFGFVQKMADFILENIKSNETTPKGKPMGEVGKKSRIRIGKKLFSN